MPTHIDLFSGIGGFALAAQWAGYTTEVFCENDKFCQEVLKKHWPEVRIIPDIRGFDGAQFRGADLLTGGFPCQPFSCAGKRRGQADDRYLWPQMLRVIAEARPRWVLAENVAGIIKMALDQVLADLESEGYSTGTAIIPACGTEATHQRQRTWIIANSKSHDGNNTCLQNNRDSTQGMEPRRFLRDESMPQLYRVDDGVSSELDRLRALGNAIVPQVAFEIIKQIADIDKSRRQEDPHTHGRDAKLGSRVTAGLTIDSGSVMSRIARAQETDILSQSEFTTRRSCERAGVSLSGRYVFCQELSLPLRVAARPLSDRRSRTCEETGRTVV